MQRRHFIRNSAITAGLLSLNPIEGIAAFFQQPAWKIKMLNKETGIFTERGGTILFSITKDGVIVIDSQFPEQSTHLIDELKKQYNKSFRLLINTHHHGDHSGGNIAYKGIVQHVLAHANSKANQERVAVQNKTEDKQLYPDQTYTDTWCEKIGKEKVCLHYFGAAHTNGDSFIHLQHANVVHMGDLLFNRRHPYVDRSSGANIKSWMSVLDKGINKFNKKTVFVFGHASEGYEVTGSAEDLKRFKEYLENILRFTESSIKAGMSKEEFIKTTNLPFTTEWKGDGLPRPLQAAYEELTAVN